MRRIVLSLVLSLFVLGCTDEGSARRILEAEGYEKIEMTGYKFLMCSEDDFYRTGFSATKNGKSISGAVCAGFFLKGSTIRLD